MTVDELQPGMWLRGYGLFVETSGFGLCYIDDDDPYYGKVYETIYYIENSQFEELYPRGSENYLVEVRKMIESRKEAKQHAEDDINWMESLIK